MPTVPSTEHQAARVNRRLFLRISALGAGVALISACQSAAQPAPTSKPVPSGAPAKPAEPAAKAAAEPAAKAPAAPAAGSSELDALVAPAKQEGEVVIYMGRAGSRQLREAVTEFEKKYGVKVSAVVGSGNENAEKVLAERDTGLFTADLWMGGLTTINSRLLPKSALDPIESLFVLPEIKEKAGWYKGQHWWGDPDKKFTVLFAASPSHIASYNTGHVKDTDSQS
jgi:hypothetical protein